MFSSCDHLTQSSSKTIIYKVSFHRPHCKDISQRDALTTLLGQGHPWSCPGPGPLHYAAGRVLKDDPVARCEVSLVRSLRSTGPVLPQLGRTFAYSGLNKSYTCLIKMIRSTTATGKQDGIST